eukprot:TRINITY_DN27897_c0_g1_i2.p1 TRINITY_DN27897_c0_g1~~TRINITY_DN27897_c0_g1_i2.p1  ORF type:complete len:373 (-),score=27.63 TRINITY_DN27897_c0_g1_i2:64-1182(-)
MRITDWWSHWWRGMTTIMLLLVLSPIIAFLVPVVYHRFFLSDAEKRDTQNYWATHSNVFAWELATRLAGGSLAVVMFCLVTPVVFGPVLTKFGCNDVSSHILFCLETGAEVPDIAISTVFFIFQVMKTLYYLYRLFGSCRWQNSDEVSCRVPSCVQFACLMGCCFIAWCYKFGVILRDGQAPGKATAATGEITASKVWGMVLAADAYILLLASATAWNSSVKVHRLCEGGLASLDRIYSSTFPVWLWLLWLILVPVMVKVWLSADKTSDDPRDGFRLVFVRELLWVRLPTCAVLVVTVLVKAPINQFMLYVALDTVMALLRLAKQLCLYSGDKGSSLDSSGEELLSRDPDDSSGSSSSGEEDLQSSSRGSLR